MTSGRDISVVTAARVDTAAERRLPSPGCSAGQSPRRPRTSSTRPSTPPRTPRPRVAGARPGPATCRPVQPRHRRPHAPPRGLGPRGRPRRLDRRGLRAPGRRRLGGHRASHPDDLDNATLSADVDALSRELDLIKRQSFIEQQARAHGLGGPGDRVHAGRRRTAARRRCAGVRERPPRGARGPGQPLGTLDDPVVRPGGLRRAPAGPAVIDLPLEDLLFIVAAIVGGGLLVIALVFDDVLASMVEVEVAGVAVLPLGLAALALAGVGGLVATQVLDVHGITAWIVAAIAGVLGLAVGWVLFGVTRRS